MSGKNIVGAVVGAVLTAGAVPAASAGDHCYDGYYGGGYATVTYGGGYCAPTYYAAPVYYAPAPAYCAPAPVVYAAPRYVHRTYVSRPYYPVHHTYRTYRTYDRGVQVGGYYNGGRNFGFGFNYRD